VELNPAVGAKHEFPAIADAFRRCDDRTVIWMVRPLLSMNKAKLLSQVNFDRNQGTHRETVMFPLNFLIRHPWRSVVSRVAAETDMVRNTASHQIRRILARPASLERPPGNGPRLDDRDRGQNGHI